MQWLQIGARHPVLPSPYLGVRDGQAVHRLGCLKQLDLLDDVGFGAQDHHPLQPALGCRTQGGKEEERPVSSVISSQRSWQQFNRLWRFFINTRQVAAAEPQNMDRYSHTCSFKDR